MKNEELEQQLEQYNRENDDTIKLIHGLPTIIDANIKSVVDYLNNNPQSTMTKFALLNVCVALMTEQIFNVGQKEIDRELKRLRPSAIV